MQGYSVAFRPIFLLVGLLCWGCFLGSCSSEHASNQDVVVQMEDHVLLRTALPQDLYQGKSREDSAIAVKQYVDTWVRNTRLYLYAEKQIGKDNPQLERQVEDFRRSLYTQSFESQYVQTKLDTLVAEPEMQQFYDDNHPLFTLKHPLVRVLLLTIPEGSQHIAEVKELYARPVNDENMQKLSSLSMKAGIQFLFTPEEWCPLTSLAKYLPADLDLALDNRRVRNAEFVKDGLVYFLAFQEWKPIGEVAPFPIVKNEVRSIILNHREVTLVRELEERIASEERAQVKWGKH